VVNGAASLSRGTTTSSDSNGGALVGQQGCGGEVNAGSNRISSSNLAPKHGIHNFSKLFSIAANAPLLSQLSYPPSTTSKYSQEPCAVVPSSQQQHALLAHNQQTQAAAAGSYTLLNGLLQDGSTVPGRSFEKHTSGSRTVPNMQTANSDIFSPSRAGINNHDTALMSTAKDVPSHSWGEHTSNATLNSSSSLNQSQQSVGREQWVSVGEQPVMPMIFSSASFSSSSMPPSTGSGTNPCAPTPSTMSTAIISASTFFSDAGVASGGMRVTSNDIAVLPSSSDAAVGGNTFSTTSKVPSIDDHRAKMPLSLDENSASTAAGNSGGPFSGKVSGSLINWQ
jgi:hypothetical protein